MTVVQLYLIAPVLLLAASGLLVLMLGVIADRFPKGKLNHFLPPDFLAIALTVPAAVFTGITLWATLYYVHPAVPDVLRNMVVVDPFAAFMGLIAVVGTLVVMAMSLDYFVDNTRHRAEFFALLIFATSAILLVAASTDLLMIYVSMEFLSLCSYVLASWWKKDGRSSEAGIKYFLFGALSSAIMLYGMSILYGVTGTTSLTGIAAAIRGGHMVSPSAMPAAWVSVIMVLAGLGFKLALVPFHLWAPDTYEGAPTPMTAWLSVASKAAGLAVVTRFLLVAIPNSDQLNWFTILLVLSAASMTLGNLVAITQKNIKRMLAYSSIAQVGYMMVGVLAASTTVVIRGSGEVSTGANYGLAGLLIYAASYLAMNLGVFAAVIAVERQTGSSDIQAFAGLMKRAPLLAVSMVIFFMSLAGIPPTAGFLGKFYVFAGAIQTGRPDLLWLAIIGVANSAISVYYYFNVVRQMFMQDTTETTTLRASGPLKAVVVLMLILTVGLLIAAGPFIALTRAAVS